MALSTGYQPQEISSGLSGMLDTGPGRHWRPPLGGLGMPMGPFTASVATADAGAGSCPPSSNPDMVNVMWAGKCVPSISGYCPLGLFREANGDCTGADGKVAYTASQFGGTASDRAVAQQKADERTVGMNTADAEIFRTSAVKSAAAGRADLAEEHAKKAAEATANVVKVAKRTGTLSKELVDQVAIDTANAAAAKAKAAGASDAAAAAAAQKAGDAAAQQAVDPTKGMNIDAAMGGMPWKLIGAGAAGLAAIAGVWALTRKKNGTSAPAAAAAAVNGWLNRRRKSSKRSRR